MTLQLVYVHVGALLAVRLELLRARVPGTAPSWLWQLRQQLQPRAPYAWAQLQGYRGFLKQNSNED